MYLVSTYGRVKYFETLFRFWYKHPKESDLKFLQKMVTIFLMCKSALRSSNHLIYNQIPRNLPFILYKQKCTYDSIKTFKKILCFCKL